MKKTLVPVLLLCALFFSLLLFRKEPAQIDQPVVQKEATLYHYFSGPLSGGINEMLDRINQRQDSTRVVAHALDHEAFKTMIKESMSGDRAPDLFSYWAGRRTQDMVDHQMLEPIDDIWDKLALDQVFPVPLAEAASVYNGKKYLLPITQHVVVFFYNKQVFKHAGVAIPATWDEFLAASEKLKQTGVTPFSLGARERWPAQFWFDYLLLRTAGPGYRTALMNGERSYTDREVVEVYQLWGSMIKAGYFNTDANDQDWPEAIDMVCRGEAAATLTGTWAIQLFTGDSCRMEAEKDFDYFVFPTIDPAIPHISVGPVDGLVMAKGTKHRKVAADVIAYASEEAMQKLMSTGSGALAPSREVLAQFYSPFKQRLLNEILTTEQWTFNYDLSTPSEIAEKGMDSFNELIAFPGEYKEILKHLQDASHELFLQLKQERAPVNDHP